MTPDELLEKAAEEAASYCQCENNGDPERFEKGCPACEACDGVRSLIGKYTGDIVPKDTATDLKTEQFR